MRARTHRVVRHSGLSRRRYETAASLRPREAFKGYRRAVPRGSAILERSIRHVAFIEVSFDRHGPDAFDPGNLAQP